MQRIGIRSVIPIAIICTSVVGVAFLFGRRGLVRLQPPEVRAENLFNNFRDDFVSVAQSIEGDKTIRFIDQHGTVNPHSKDVRVVPQYRNLIQVTSAQFIEANGDGTIDFAMYSGGNGAVQDSQIGIRFHPAPRETARDSSKSEVVVSSFLDGRLPKNIVGEVIGSYVIPIETNWFIYRKKYR